MSSLFNYQSTFSMNQNQNHNLKIQILQPNMTAKKALASLKSKFLNFNPWKKLTPLISRFKLKKPLFIKALRFHSTHTKLKKHHNTTTKTTTTTTTTTTLVAKLLSVLRLRKKPKKIDRLRELLTSTYPDTPGGNGERELIQSPPRPPPDYPSGVTDGTGRTERDARDHEEIEDACRTFENYLVEMIVEDGRVRDLIDVEELLYYWKNLKCPVFTEMVSRFHGELCRDLFSADTQRVNNADSL